MTQVILVTNSKKTKMTMSNEELKNEPIRESVEKAFDRLEQAIDDFKNHDAGEEDLLNHANQALYNRKHFSMAVTTLVSLLEDFVTDFDDNVEEDEEDEDESEE